MKNLLIIATATFAFSLFSAQAAVNDSIKFKNSSNPISFHLLAGTSFITGFQNRGSALSTFITPQFSYPLSKRFTIDAGFAIVNTSFNANFSGNNETPKKSFANNYTSTLIYAGGKYFLNERFTLSGQAYTQVGAFENNDYQKKKLNNNIKGATFGVDYKITENSSIGIHLNYSNGNSPFYNNSYGMQNQNSFYNR